VQERRVCSETELFCSLFFWDVEVLFSGETVWAMTSWPLGSWVSGVVSDFQAVSGAYSSPITSLIAICCTRKEWVRRSIFNFIFVWQLRSQGSQKRYRQEGKSGWFFPTLLARLVFSRKQLNDVGIKQYICRMRFAHTKQQLIIANHIVFFQFTERYIQKYGTFRCTGVHKMSKLQHT
jgi:hypothetical protein